MLKSGIDISFDKETKCGGFGEYYENYYIRCNKCGCKKTFTQGYLGTKVYTEEECIREWNTRVYWKENNWWHQIK